MHLPRLVFVLELFAAASAAQARFWARGDCAHWWEAGLWGAGEDGNIYRQASHGYIEPRIIIIIIIVIIVIKMIIVIPANEIDQIVQYNEDIFRFLSFLTSLGTL